MGFGFGLEFSEVLALSLIIGLVAYPLGDLMVLPRSNNVVASMSDFVLSFVITWFYLSYLTAAVNNIFLMSTIAAIGVAICEYFFHKYMASSHILDDERIGVGEKKIHYKTEASEEISPETSKEDHKEENESK